MSVVEASPPRVWYFVAVPPGNTYAVRQSSPLISTPLVTKDRTEHILPVLWNPWCVCSSAPASGGGASVLLGERHSFLLTQTLTNDTFNSHFNPQLSLPRTPVVWEP